MPAIPYIRKKIGSSNLVWFENSNSYVQLEEPAWFVFHKTTLRCRPSTIAKAFEQRYGISGDNSIKFVNEILAEIEKLNKMEITGNECNPDIDMLSGYQFTPYSIHQYYLGDNPITFTFESRIFEYYIHPLISHLETEFENRDIPHFELFEHEKKVVYRFNGEVKGVWSSDETHLVKGKIFIDLINVMHTKTDDDWLMTVHASAISNRKKTILFSASPGNGKTTMAALLQSRGYQLISDDFVPIDRKSFNAWPFPIAMSVKQGSMNLLVSLFPELEHKELSYITPEKSVRYLANNVNQNSTPGRFPVKEVVFIAYNPKVDFIVEKLDTISGFKLLLDQAWIVPFAGNAEILLEWIPSVTFIKLTYSDNEKALNAITELFSHEQ